VYRYASHNLIWGWGFCRQYWQNLNCHWFTKCTEMVFKKINLIARLSALDTTFNVTKRICYRSKICWFFGGRGVVVYKYYNNCLHGRPVPLAIVRDTGRVIFFSHVVCLRSFDSIYMVTYYLKWVKTSWTYSIKPISDQPKSVRHAWK